ncbi:MAG: phosphate acetyltransferase [Candidatus Omnitrophica bacterium]|nr:phosphate acetyltransferase [Candidatus Omnitrophota bacterium]
MDTIKLIREKARSSRKTIVLPEYNDNRVVEAAKIIEAEKIAKAVLLTKEMMDPQIKERYIREYYEMRKGKGIELADVRDLFEDTLFYGAMMVHEGKVDGMVAGASHTTADVARASIHCIGVEENLRIASSCFIMVVPNSRYGEGGTFVFADCGIIPDPNSRQLACIAITAADLMRTVLGVDPRVAFLSYSTHGSARGRSIDKITEAVGLVREMAPGLLVDGELQVDAAIVPEVARIKKPVSLLDGKSNVLIFPNLEAGNIAYKIVERLANARALGPLLLGLKRPGSDLSRGCSADDVVDCAAVTAIRA